MRDGGGFKLAVGDLVRWPGLDASDRLVSKIVRGTVDGKNALVEYSSGGVSVRQWVSCRLLRRVEPPR